MADLVNTKNIEWVTPGKLFSSAWIGFLQSSNRKTNKSNRFFAKCVHCNQVLDGKARDLIQHALINCLKIKPLDRLTYSNKNKKTMHFAAGEHSEVTQNNTDSSSSFFRKRSKDSERNLHILLMKAFITSSIPFRFLENSYFIEYQK